MADLGDNERRLDVSSEKFDPELALSSANVVVPDPGAKVFDNLEMFVSSLNRVTSATNMKRLVKEPKHPGMHIERKFLPHQQMIHAAPRRPGRNILTRMQETEGPLAVLARCMQARTRVKVWTRGAASLRGSCTGFVAAFDKMWNLALTDVDEVFTRRKRRKFPLLGDVSHVTEHIQRIQLDQDEEPLPPGTLEMLETTEPGKTQSSAQERRKKRAVAEPLTGVEVIKSVGRNLEICHRHINQLFVRGEQIVTITICRM